MSPSEEFIERYRRIERATDAFGRVIGVKRLKVSQQVKITEMTPSLEGYAEMVDKDGNTVLLPRRSIPIIAAAVCEIDGQPIPFPTSRGDIDGMIDRLDEEGLVAATAAYAILTPGAKKVVDDQGSETTEQPESEAEAAKK